MRKSKFRVCLWEVLSKDQSLKLISTMNATLWYSRFTTCDYRFTLNKYDPLTAKNLYKRFIENMDENISDKNVGVEQKKSIIKTVSLSICKTSIGKTKYGKVQSTAR